MPKFSEYAPILVREKYPDLSERQVDELVRRSAETAYGAVVANSPLGIVRDLDEPHYLHAVAVLVQNEPGLVRKIPSAEEVANHAAAEYERAHGHPMPGSLKIEAYRKAATMSETERAAALPDKHAAPPVKPTPASPPTTRGKWATATQAEIDAEIERAFGVPAGTLPAGKRRTYTAAIRGRDQAVPASLDAQAVAAGAVSTARLTPTERIRLHREEQARLRKAGSK